jgi:NADP-dependent 3-hydroxy acid dehydrogenase YdfG
VILTGASSGIGEYLAYELASKNSRLLLVARREDLLRTVADRCRDLGARKVEIHVADVSDQEENKSMVEAAVKHFGQLDAIVSSGEEGGRGRKMEMIE